MPKKFKHGEYRITLQERQVVKVKVIKDTAGELRWQAIEVLSEEISDYKTLREQAKLISGEQEIPWHFGIIPGGLVNNRYSNPTKISTTSAAKSSEATQLSGVTATVNPQEQKHSATNILPAIKTISGNEFKLLIAETPNRAITFASERVESCSYLLRELYDDPDQDLTDWLSLGDGAQLDEFDPDWRDIDAFDVVYPEISGIPSVSLRIGDILYYIPLTHAIELVAGHFKVSAPSAEARQDVLARGATPTAIELWQAFDRSLAQLKLLVQLNLPDLQPLKTL